MKLLKLVLATLVFVPGLAMAHGNIIETVTLAVDEALAVYEQENGRDQFGGVKAWKDGAKIKVKVFQKDSSSVTYNCEMNHAPGEPEKMTCL